MRKAALLGLLPLTIACSDVAAPGEPFVALASGMAQTFVLSIVEDQRTDPIITFDHQCTDGHHQKLLRDTIQLFPDGTARRAIKIEHRLDGQLNGESYIPASGTWSSRSPSLPPGSQVTLQLTPPTGSSYSMPLRVRRDGLSNSLGLGGTCWGSTWDGRGAESIYTSR